MADHYSLIGGAAGEIESGRVLLGGASYEIESGRTLVNGVSQEIEFASGAQIELSGTMSADYAYAIIGASQYATAGTVEVEPGTVVSVYAMSSNTTAGISCYISRNGVKVKTGQGSYSFEVTGNTTIVFGRGSVTVSNRLQPYYYAEITTS